MLFIIEWPELVDVWIIIMMIMNLIFFVTHLQIKEKRILLSFCYSPMKNSDEI